MKKNAKRTFTHRLLFACFPILLMFLGTACEKDSEADEGSNRFIGTWHQTSKTTDDLPVSKDSSRLVIQINETQICILCDSSAIAVTTGKIIQRSGWSYSGGLFNLAIDLPASWKPVADEKTLSLERLDFNPNGTIRKTRLTYVRIPNIEIK